ncbi:ribose transport system substrate-binding protein [Paenibacillus shirakamiensis]|uniref:Ribose transport system substrate-binding protein n=1 Tax=Paenibacillus shirakamiensis TaxID=1265935 RepID=A0ABS4JD16_9BACL|nr:substrate-binding domain-containing protein [Paenibacillus shirakamiensis]MBP1999617.1 ribose transport system substrate-binding protein [Paenibacillus shirakamiensis]
MNRSKLVGRFVVLALLFLSAASCSLHADLGQKSSAVTHVDMIVKMDHGDYWKTVKMGAEVAAKEYNVQLNFKAPTNENDYAAQIQMMKQSIADHTEAIILSASDYMALAQVTDQASYAGIPVISMDAEVASTKVKTYIGANNYEAGQKAAQRLIQLTGPDSEIGIINFVQGARNADQRAEGFMDYVARFSGIHLVGNVYCGSDELKAKRLTQQMILEYPHLEGIVALNAEASIGVGKAIDATGQGGHIQLITFDNPPEMLEKLQEKIVQAMVVQNPYSNGYLAVKSAVEAAEGKDIAERLDTGTKLIDLDNMLWPENQKLLFPFVK